jgi:hypothetical protein
VIEYIRVWTRFLKDAAGNPIKWWRTVPNADYRKRDGDSAWSVQVQIKRVGDLVEALRPHMPRLAEAISRAFGGVAGVVDEELEACKARIDMHNKVTPSDVTNADALDAIERVRHAFNMRAPAGLRPLPFQLVGIAFAQQADYRALIADAPGLGKTIQGLGCVLTDPEMLLPALFVVPKNVLFSWKDETAKWLPSVPVHMLETRSAELPEPGWKGIILTTWDVMVPRATALSTWGVRFLLADEAHYAKEPSAQRTKSLKALAAAIPHVVLLTGTPINRADRNTFWAFGADEDSAGYMSRYSFQDSIRDKATLPLHFEAPTVSGSGSDEYGGQDYATVPLVSDVTMIVNRSAAALDAFIAANPDAPESGDYGKIE